MTQKVSKKVKAGKITALSCHTAMFGFCATVALALVILLLGAVDPRYKNGHQVKAFASAAGGLRTCAGATFASLEKYAAHFSNPPRRTKPNEAPYTGTGNKNKTDNFCREANTC